MKSDAKISQKLICPICYHHDIIFFLDISGVPVYCNVLLPSRHDALNVAKGDIQLGFCEKCGHIYNFAFDPGIVDYTQEYENSLHFSPKFQEYAGALAARLHEKYDLINKDIIEIGCGKGDFLRMLCELGDNRGFGFDPSFEYDRTDPNGNREITFIQDYYSERYSHYRSDILCCRHVLEHVQNPRNFLGKLRQTIGDRADTVVFFEVPNVLYTLRDMGIWDLIYEHCSYFSPSSISRLFELCGFVIIDLWEAFDSQYICVEAKPDRKRPISGKEEEINDLGELVGEFALNYRNKVETWKRNLERYENKENVVMVWGGGSKGVTFLNTLQVKEQIEFIIDINPHKKGKYIPGTGQKVVPPEFIQKYNPNLILVMNPIYLNEIHQTINNMGVNTKLLTV